MGCFELPMNTDDCKSRPGPGINSRARVNKVRLFGGLAATSGGPKALHTRHNPASSPSGLCCSKPMNLFMGYISRAYDAFGGGRSESGGRRPKVVLVAVRWVVSRPKRKVVHSPCMYLYRLHLHGLSIGLPIHAWRFERKGGRSWAVLNYQ
jgi:hypothetical protein